MNRKERTTRQYSTGFVAGQSGTDVLYRGEFVPNACVYTNTSTIEYGVKARFNACNHSTRQDVSGWPASCASYANRNIHHVGGSPGVQPRAEMLDSQIMRINPRYAGTRIGYNTSDLDRARKDAALHLQALTPNRTMNLLQSVCELKDTRSTLNQFLSFVSWARSKAGTVLKRGPVRKRLSLLDSAATVASTYLWYRFGVEPTVTDVKRFMREVSQGKLQVRGHLNKVTVARKGQVLTSRYRVGANKAQIAAAMFSPSAGKVDEDTGVYQCSGSLWKTIPTGDSYTQFPYGGNNSSYPLARQYVSTVRVNGCMFAEVKSDVEIDGRKELQRQLDWNCPLLGTAWELIPFSFLVDWVIDVGDTIRRLERQALALRYRRFLSGIWIAEKEITETWYPSLMRYDVHIAGREAPSTASNGGRLNLSWTWEGGIWRQERKVVFHRRAYDPSVFAPVRVANSIKAYQLSTGMALLAQFAAGWRRSKHIASARRNRRKRSNIPLLHNKDTTK